MPYLTAPQALELKQRTYRYFVELASNSLDYEGVPERFRVIDVVITENTDAAIRNLIASAGWLDDYTIVSAWVPSDCEEF